MKKAIVILLFLVSTAFAMAQSYEQLVTRAMDYIEQKDYIAAEQAIKAALRKDAGNQGNTLLIVNLGTVQRNLGKYDEALLSYNIVLDKYPQQLILLHSRAALYCEMGKEKEALQDYSDIIRIAPSDIEALYQRGLLYLSSAVPLAARVDFESICALQPNNLRGRMGIAMVLKRTGEWIDAEKIYTDLIANNRTNASLYFNRAECYLQLKQAARAQEDLVKASEYGYNEAPLYILRGQVRLAQYDKLSAKEAFLKAKELGGSPLIIDDYLRMCK